MSSSPFRFIVGPDKLEYSIHAALVAEQSPALNALVNGGLKESVEQCVVWQEVDKDTFIRFAQYLYTGDYHCASLPVSDTKPPDTVADIVDIWAMPSPRSKTREGHLSDEHFKSDGESPQKMAAQELKKRQYPVPEMPPSAPYHVNDETTGSATSVMLPHAKLYILAECYGIEPLMQMTLHKLHREMCGFSPLGRGLNNAVEVIKFGFENDTSELQDLLSLFASTHLKALWSRRDFQELFVKSGELAMALMGNMMRHLS